MTEKRRKRLDNCFKIFNILDKLDEIGDSDNDNCDLLRKCKKNLKQRHRVDEEPNVPKISKKSIQQTVSQISNIWSPTKGLKDGQNPLEILSKEQFVKNYRFSKECVEDILQMISYGLNKFTNRGKPFSPMVQLLITLQFLATGTVTHYYCVVKYINFTKPPLSY